MNVLETSIDELLQKEPYLKSFFSTHGLPLEKKDQSVATIINRLRQRELEDLGTSRETLKEGFEAFVEHARRVRKGKPIVINSIHIKGGTHKDGTAENLDLELEPGDILCLVGETGSGKSRLLADIEWLAKGDTPTRRKILINGELPENSWRFSVEQKMVAQLSQNMNFIMDLSVEEYLYLHADSRMIEKSNDKIAEILDKANELSGESFDGKTCLTALSGGQSRALMVADTALLSHAPIILIDELENAGIHRGKALELLLSESKIILIATHDPVLALYGHKRLVLKNGGVQRVIPVSDEEKLLRKQLEAMDAVIMKCRQSLRKGEVLRNL